MESSKNEVLAEQNRIGSITISENVVKVIAGIAASNVPGVAEMSSSIADVFGRRSSSRGIKVEIGEKQATVSLHIIVEFGVRIPDVAAEVQATVKNALEEMTGLAVIIVNVTVEGVSFGNEGHNT
ncbi:Asp23/Gls24 family envelope stress response protein [Desulfolucanica intricata]|uniref:Asp23/Gls24 family envelope stress response protein n=1 Tax=Desulfolucanica intricata TaxID=1285191 RepID=UPI00082C173C|nr:Asp23/Gls24 family envelope stress response protein [Desulfolucanica intricata]